MGGRIIEKIKENGFGHRGPFTSYMNPERKKICDALYEEYKELAVKTHIVVEDYVPGKELKSQTIHVEDILKKEEIRKKLLETCKDYLHSQLNPEELFEIENS